MARVLRLSACALAFCAIVAPAALADPPDVSVTISGIVERTHADTNGGARPITVLSTPTGPQAVTFASDQPVPPNGADVDLTGRLVGATLQTDTVTVTGPALAVPASGAGGGRHAQQAAPVASGTPRTVAIVVITLGTVTPSYSDAQLQNVLVSNTNSVSNYFSEQSYGAVSFTGINSAAGDVFHVTLAASSGCPWQTWGSQAAAAAPAINSYDNVVYVFNSQHQCGFAGVAWLPGWEAFIDNAFTLPVVAHELGHNLGVHHAASLRCTSGGQTVAFANTNLACTPSEYGDMWDVMGSSPSNQQNAFHKLQSGWLGAASGPRVQSITTSGSYTVTPLEAASGVALLLIPHVTAGTVADPSTTLGDTFALDFRQPSGAFDTFGVGSSATSGVQIRLVQTPGSGYPSQTELLDATPLTPGNFNDASLTQGSTFVDAADAITIVTTDVNPLGATVQVTIGSTGGGGGGTTGGGGVGPTPPDTTPPTGVSGLAASVASGPVVTLAYAGATDDRAVASYRITRDTSQIDNLSGSQTAYADWTATYGPHTYGVTAIDSSGNAGPTATVIALVAAPAPTTPTIKSPPSTRPPATTKPTTPARRTVKVKMKIVRVSANTRRVQLSWKRIAGAHTYAVTRNGRAYRSTRGLELVDDSPPRGALHYTVVVGR
ncbi:MAG: hypothetical protein QOH74_1891 [Gaiellales bacterium]|nr:hypothetical protein [Gaiellales bacterium]